MDKNEVDNNTFLKKLITQTEPIIAETTQEEDSQVLQMKERKKKEKTLKDDLISSLLNEKNGSRRLQVMAYIRPEIHNKIEEISIKSRSSMSKVIEKILEESLK